jgi:hypothetical protein
MRNKVAGFFAQCRPKNGWKTLYTAVGGELVSYVNVANVGDVNCRWSMCIAPDGQGYKRNTALVWNEEITEHDNDVWGYGIPLAAGMRIGVYCSVDNALNFTAYGTFI